MAVSLITTQIWRTVSEAEEMVQWCDSSTPGALSTLGMGEPNLPSKGDLAMQGVSKAVKRPGDNPPPKKIDFPSNINNTNYTSLLILTDKKKSRSIDIKV